MLDRSLEEPRERPEYRYKTAYPQLERVCDALRAEKGLVTPAAKRLGMDPGNLHRYIKAHARCQDVQRLAREGLCDLAERKLIDLVEVGDYRAISFLLASLAKARGYGLPPNSMLNNFGDTTTNNVVIQSVKIVSVPSGVFLPADQSARENNATVIEGVLEDNRTADDL